MSGLISGREFIQTFPSCDKDVVGPVVSPPDFGRRLLAKSEA